MQNVISILGALATGPSGALYFGERESMLGSEFAELHETRAAHVGYFLSCCIDGNGDAIRHPVASAGIFTQEHRSYLAFRFAMNQDDSTPLYILHQNDRLEFERAFRGEAPIAEEHAQEIEEDEW